MMCRMNTLTYPGQIDSEQLAQFVHKVFAVCRDHWSDEKKSDNVVVSYRDNETFVDILLRYGDVLSSSEQNYLAVLLDGLVAEHNVKVTNVFQNVRPDATWVHITINRC